MAAQRAGSMSPAHRTAATISSTSLTRKPVRPSSISSGAAPRAMLIAAVPLAIASTTESPNGSSHWIGASRATARASKRAFSTPATLPMWTTRLPSRAGAMWRSKYSRPGAVVSTLPASTSRNPTRRATSIARCCPLSGEIRARHSRYGSFSSRLPTSRWRSETALGTVPSHGSCGADRRWLALMAARLSSVPSAE